MDAKDLRELAVATKTRAQEMRGKAAEATCPEFHLILAAIADAYDSQARHYERQIGPYAYF